MRTRFQVMFLTQIFSNFLVRTKIYTGVPDNLVAFACKLSFDKGHNGYLAFDAKTILVQHYQETLFATHFKGTKMIIETPAANRLINKYFKK